MKFFCAILPLLVTTAGAIGQISVDSLTRHIQDHPQQDTVRVNILNEVSFRILKSDPEKSYAFSQEALALARRINYFRGIGEAQINQSACQLVRGNTEVALEKTLEAVKLGEAHHLQELLAESYSMLGSIYHDQKHYKKALSMLAVADQFNSTAKNPVITSNILSIRGGIARDQIQYDSSLIYYNQALQVMEAIHEHYNLPEVLNSIGVVYHRQLNPELAMKYYFLALEAARRHGNKNAEAQVAHNIGYTYLSDKNIKKAKEYLCRSLELSRQLGNRRNLSSTYIALMQLENERGDFPAAHQYMISYYKLKDSLVNADKARQIAELEVRYETEKKEMAIQLLERQNKIQQLQTNILIAAFLLLIISAIIIYYLQTIKDRKNRRILNLEIDYLTSRHRALSEKFKNMLTHTIKPTESLDQRILQKAIEVIESNISDPLFGVERLGKEMGMSRTNLHRKVKAITGFPPSELIRSIRLKKAASLLLSQADSVSQISFAVGFEDQSYFSKSFKKQFGVPPSEYMGSLNRSAN